MNSYLLVMLGGALGSGARFALGNIIAARWGSAFPWATLSVNILGCLAMGALAGWLAQRGEAEAARLLFGVGLLGGFTTFSAFSLDLWQLAERGAMASALAYLAATLVATLAAFALGLTLARTAA
jgi:fluoride exporter